GGHADHDATHVVAAMLARSLGQLDNSFQVPFYRAADRLSPGFALFAPLAENGPIFVERVDMRLSLARITLVRRYPSQWRSMLGLGPVLLWHAIAHTPFRAQLINTSLFGQRP